MGAFGHPTSENLESSVSVAVVRAGVFARGDPLKHSTCQQAKTYARCVQKFVLTEDPDLGRRLRDLHCLALLALLRSRSSLPTTSGWKWMSQNIQLFSHTVISTNPMMWVRWWQGLILVQIVRWLFTDEPPCLKAIRRIFHVPVAFCSITQASLDPEPGTSQPSAVGGVEGTSALIQRLTMSSATPFQPDPCPRRCQCISE